MTFAQGKRSEVRLQLKSTLVDRIIRDLGLIPPDHDVIKKPFMEADLHLKYGLRKDFKKEICFSK